MHQTLDDLLKNVLGNWPQIAESCGLSQRALFNLRAGLVSKPRRATVIAMAAALRVSPDVVRQAILNSAAARQNLLEAQE